MEFNKLIAAMSAVTMLGSLAVAMPMSASAADTDASVTAYDNFRVNTNKNKVVEGVTYYGNAHIGNVLTGEGYNGGTINKAETKVSARFYNLMRINIPSGNTQSVTVSVTSANNNVPFEIYSYSSTVDWKDLAYTDNDHAGTTDNDYQTYYDASVAAGYDWSGLGTNTFTAVSPIATATTAGGKLTFTLSTGDNSLTAADLTAGYKDILIKNNTLDSACNLSAPETPTVTTVLEEVQHPVAKIGLTDYESFTEAYTAAKDGDEIVLLDDVTADSRFTIAKAITISGNGKKITSKADILITNNVTINGVNVTTANQAKLDANNITVTVNNATVTGGIVLGKANGILVLDSTTTVDTVKTRNGNTPNATKESNTVNGNGTITTLYYYSDKDVIDNNLTIREKIDTYTTDEYFSFEGEDGVSYDTVEVTASKGEKEETQSASITNITGGSLYVAILGVPADVTIKTVTLK